MNVSFAIIGTLKLLDLGLGHMFECHDVSMTAYELKSNAILNVKGVDFRCIQWGIRRNEGLRRLNNSVLEDKGVL